MKEHPQEPRPAPPSASERDDVRVATSRCPFCREDVPTEADDWVSCRRCQARHHAPCWAEGGDRCSACGETRALAAAAGTAPAARAPRRALGPFALAVGVVTAFVGLVLGASVGYSSRAPRADFLIWSGEVGRAGLQPLGLLLTAALTLPGALLGVGLSVGGLARREPGSASRLALGVNVAYALVIVFLTLASLSG